MCSFILKHYSNLALTSLLLPSECGSNCASGCNSNGGGKCDSKCADKFALSNSFTCLGWLENLHSNVIEK